MTGDSVKRIGPTAFVLRLPAGEYLFADFARPNGVVAYEAERFEHFGIGPMVVR